MLFLGKAPVSALKLLERLASLTALIFKDHTMETQTRRLAPQDNLLDQLDVEQLGLIRSGLVTVINDDVDVACFEPGDIIGLHRVFGLPCGRLRADDTVEIELVHRDDFMEYINSDPHRQHRFSNYLLTCMGFYEVMLSHYHRQSHVQAPTGFQNVAKGGVMISEGDFADTVYQLISGSADVTVKGVTVGEVLSGEIFGAMAAFTGEKRTATVIAREESQLLAIPKVEFVNLIKAQPEVAVTLLENMSRRIQSLNEQLTEEVAV
ncbi:cAMP-binding protein CbpA [Oceaniserpentilla sp. 4NH20-0058]